MVSILIVAGVIGYFNVINGKENDDKATYGHYGVNITKWHQ
jgi:hypothetical protein